MTQTDRPIRVCLLQHSTRSDNLGVGALTVAEIEILRRLARDMGRPLEITIFDWREKRAPYVHGPDVRIVDLDRWSLVSRSGLLGQARRADVVIDIGAGDSFADIYQADRLRKIFILKGLAHLSGAPLVMAPQTIGPFTKPLSRRLAVWTMRRSALVVSRDEMSTAAAREMGISDVLEASDVALRLPYDPPAPRDPGGPVKVGLNVSGLLFHGGYTGRNEFGLKGDYAALVRDLIRHFQSHADGCEVHLVGHVIPDTPDRRLQESDDRAHAVLEREFPGTVRAPLFASPSEAKSYIAGLDFFMGARMHACIAAFSSGVPVVPMAYSRKFEGMFGSLGYRHTVNCTTEGADVLMRKIAAAYTDRETLRAEVAVALEVGLAKLARYDAALRQVIEKGRRGR